ncbi:unnamed protein product [Trichogramma brassicae]|uniref:Uncharacterized protein n=1 Tax=Trichogramma brassicae TaxID=86971 RepID=A0A6H5HWP6_9HYME|nr:unnamed protein product [Trichogramma brassicae]
MAAADAYRDEPEIDENGIISPRRTTPIHHAVKKNEEFRQWIYVFPLLFDICGKFDVNYTDESGYTHFHAACQFSCVRVVQGFLEHGQDPNCIWPETGDSALHIALRFAWTNDIMILLLRGGADPNLPNKKGSTPLHIIAKEDSDCEKVKLFFQINDELNQLVQIDARDKLGNTPIHLALEHGDQKKMMEIMLRRGASPNLANDKGSTPLHIISKRHTYYCDDLTEYFFKINDELNQRVQVDARDRLALRGISSHLWHAFRWHKSQILAPRCSHHTRVRSCANLTLRYQKAALVSTFSQRCEEVAVTWPPVAASSATRGRIMREYFMWPAIGTEKHRFSCVRVVQGFLEHGQDPNCIWPETGDSALHIALRFAWTNDIMILLLRGGADPNLPNKKGSTPLHIIAKEDSDCEKVKLFFQINDELNQLVQIDARDKLGNTPIHLALEHGDQKKMMEIMLRRGASPNLANDKGSTPLHIISKRHTYYCDDLTEYFFKINDELNQRVQVDARDRLGRTPLQCAVVNCSPYAVESFTEPWRQSVELRISHFE